MEILPALLAIALFFAGNLVAKRSAAKEKRGAEQRHKETISAIETIVTARFREAGLIGPADGISIASADPMQPLGPGNVTLEVHSARHAHRSDEVDLPSGTAGPPGQP